MTSVQLAPHQVRALDSIGVILASHRSVLIGALAIQCQVPMPRLTNDVDVAMERRVVVQAAELLVVDNEFAERDPVLAQVEKYVFELGNARVMRRGGQPAVAEPKLLGITKGIAVDRVVHLGLVLPGFQETTKG